VFEHVGVVAGVEGVAVVHLIAPREARSLLARPAAAQAVHDR